MLIVEPSEVYLGVSVGVTLHMAPHDTPHTHHIRHATPYILRVAPSTLHLAPPTSCPAHRILALTSTPHSQAQSQLQTQIQPRPHRRYPGVERPTAKRQTTDWEKGIAENAEHPTRTPLTPRRRDDTTPRPVL